MASGNRATKQVSSLSRGSLLSHASIYTHDLSFRRSSGLSIHFRHQVHLMRIVHELTSISNSSINSSDRLASVLIASHDLTRIVNVTSKALYLALRGSTWDLVVVVLRVGHILLHRAEHGHIECLLVSVVFHEVCARGCSEFHLVSNFVMISRALTMMGSVQNDDILIIALMLPVFLMENRIILLVDELHLLVI